MMVDFTQITCCSEGCHCVFAVPTTVYKTWQESEESWHCPYGHSQRFTESETTRLRRERDRLAQKIAQRDDEIKEKNERLAAKDRMLTATKGHVTRIKNRVSHGVCPCCSRSFENLKRHMASKHPQFRKEEAA